MSFEWFVAKRYLRSPNRPAVLRLVTWFSVIGVAAGVATLVIALAMNSGFRETLQDRLLGVTAHISLTHPGDSGGIRNYAGLSEKLQQTPGVKSATPAIYQTVLLSFGGQARETPTDNLSDPLWNPHSFGRQRGSPLPILAKYPALLDQMQQHLADKEWIARGLRADDIN